VGLDQKLLYDLLHAGLNCPAFNERQKYTLCINSEISSEINKFPEIGKWFPFDSLVKMPNFPEEIHRVGLHTVNISSSILTFSVLCKVDLNRLRAENRKH
jgi:hypothetical protein